MQLLNDGNAGPSPRPNKPRMIKKVNRLVPKAVRAVKADHQATAKAATRRCPNRSDSMPPGICIMA